MRTWPSPAPGWSGTRSGLGAGLAALICVATFGWMCAGWEGWTDRASFLGRKGDYYSLLVHGFRSGHLYLDFAPDPRLASLDPMVRASASTLLDASYYRGHYYLTYGPVPALLFLLPYSWLAGGDIEPRFAVLFFVVVGFFFSFALWTRVMREHFVGLGAPAAFVSVLALGLASGTPLLLTRAIFYELAVAGGFAMVMGTLFFTHLALCGPPPRWRPLAAASLAAGLAVGCRSDLVLVLPALAAAVALCSWRDRRTGSLGSSLSRNTLAGVLPAAAVGVGLATYNFERFGSVLDFGFNHAINSFFSSGDPLLRPSFFWANLRWDYLTWPALSPYFPFVFPEGASFRPSHYNGAEQIHGEFCSFLLIAFSVATFLIARPGRLDAGLRDLLVVIALAFLGPFLLLSFMGFRADRYLVDFHPALLLIGLVLAGLAYAAISGRHGRRAWLAAFISLGLLAAGFNVLAGLEQFHVFEYTRPIYARLCRLADAPAHWAYKMRWLDYGPVQMTVTFPGDVHDVRIEPLVTVGTPDHTDGVDVIELPDNRVQFLAQHFGYGGPRSPVIPIVPGQRYRLVVNLGAFYPPLYSRYFASWPGTRAAELIKDRIELSLDDRQMLRERMNAYDAPPWTLELGRNDLSYDGFRREFSGGISDFRREPVIKEVDYVEHDGVWSLHCPLPPGGPPANLPLLSYGRSGAGVLVYLIPLGRGQFRLAYDNWGYGGPVSAPFPISTEADHTFDIVFGSLAAAHPWPNSWQLSRETLAPLRHQVIIWADGRLRLQAELKRELRVDEDFVDFGKNPQGFSTSIPEYPGEVAPEMLSNSAKRELLERALRESSR